MDKGELRKSIKREWSQLSFDQTRQLQNDFVANLSKLFDYLPNFSHIGVYSPLADEPNWAEAFGDDLSAGLAYPECLSTGEMVFRHARDRELIMREMFQTTIKQPSQEAREVTPEILLVPGLGFDLQGRRLGRGKGYYDRYLAEFDGPAIGLCYDFQIKEEIPTESHDIRVDALVSEKGIHDITGVLRELNSKKTIQQNQISKE